MSNPSACPVCQDLLPATDEGIRVSLTDVARSATAGCDSCRLIRHAINDCVPQALVPQNGRNTVDIVIRQAIMRAFVEIAVRWHGTQSIIIDLLVKPNAHNPWPSIRIGTPTSGNTISGDSFQVVEHWLEKCKSSHESCRPSSKTFRPRRLLDLNIVQPNVLLSEPSGDEIKYVCLSHCWGGYRGITTTMESIQAFRSAIVFANLPRTFQEAVIFTRKLGVRYLWVDSLCIIQDSEKDWQEQSAVMSSIYAHSYVTLAATGSESDDGGLFFRHPKATIGGISRHGIDYQIHARPVIDHMDDAQFPLFKRAWVFQERLLAPRVLHFGRQELFWECNESVHCECNGIHGERYGTGQEKFMSKTTHQEAFHKQDLKHLRRRWHAIVEEYTQLSLTRVRDKLPALGGIAEQMASGRQGAYLAGLWRDTLLLDMLWYHSDALGAYLVGKWRAPSWSWANLEGVVKYFDAPTVQESPNTAAPHDLIPSLKEAFVEIVEAVTRAANPDNPFGEVLSAHLRLRGYHTPVVVFDGRTGSGSAPRSSSLPLHLRRRVVRRQTFRSSSYEFRFENLDSTDTFPFFADYDLQKLDPNFAVATFAALRIGVDTGDEEYALLLKLIHKEQGIWERVGLFTTKFERWRSSDHRETYLSGFAAQRDVVEFTLV